jgi:hypothetical protein
MRLSHLVCGVAALLILGCDDDLELQTHAHRSRATSKANDLAIAVNSNATELGSAGGEVQFGGLVLTAPSGWSRKSPQSSFILAEFALPGVSGSESDGRLTLSVAGGSVADNVQRWKGQFGGVGAAFKQESQTINGIQVTLVDCRGDFNDQRGPYAPAVKRTDYQMLAAIIPVDSELHFVKAVGPRSTIAAHAERIKKFIKSVKASK